MKFSVIIPVYNSAAFLEKCIDSLVKQQYRDYELILVDDGSADSSCEICLEYARRYDHIRVLQQENSGPSAARNAGIRMATGDYLTFVDSDDWVTPDYFFRLEAAAASSPDLIFFGICHPNGKVLQNKTFPAQTVTAKNDIVQFLSRNFYQGDLASCVNKAFARPLFQQGKLWFPESTVVEEDLLFVLQALDRSTTLVSITDSIYYYNRRCSGSVTTKYNPAKFDCKLRAYQAELDFARKWNCAELEHIFDDNYLTYISASINNLMYPECELSRKQKLAEIRRFYNAEQTTACVRRAKGVSFRSKVMHRLIQWKLYRMSYLLHYVTFHGRGR